MDTGSGLSFVDAKLVDELQLKVEGKTTLRLKTFGTKVAKEEEHRVVEVCMIDREGITHKCQLFDSPVIACKVNKPQLTAEDLQYIKENSIQLSTLPDDYNKPRILLGCDHLWEMVEGGKHRLPSGLHLINTKFGYMVSGKKKPSSAEEENPAVLQTETSQEKQDIWDNYWKMESSGTNEYTGTEKDEKNMTDEKVMKKFKETIVKKPDGQKNLYVEPRHDGGNQRRSLKQYKESKKIFNNLNTNIREFAANDEEIRSKLAEEDRNPSDMTKVLGIEWNTKEDKLVIECVMQPTQKITKRMVLHVNTSPSALDEILSEEDQEQWKKLCDSMRGFKKEFLRRITNKNASHQLIAYSDASNSAMAACVYIRQNQEQKLVIAKSKLPSLKGVHTIPKLEMNALTMRQG
ncbi:hypothetical protein OESDEN_06675 [Oesophagostomum dentatum]|uniref:Uncharacterized protein n=1 Tax=Oesophagostomum dentatum TaxID=61180 RepID=A0A0B1TDH2_OESDE|nr:hypothetical protein OESDEN_06675 [Oesophagostomum dentatum]